MTKKRFVLDLTLSITKFGQDASGVLRVEREIAKTILRSSFTVEFFVYSAPQKTFFALDRQLASAIVGLEPLSEQQTQQITFGPSFDFQKNDIVIAAGYVWDWNYLDDLKAIKHTIDLKFIAILYDIIPILYPEFAYPGLKAPYESYISGLSDIADFVYCISKATANDFTTFLHTQNRRQPALRHITLGSDIVNVPSTYVPRLLNQVQPKAFALCVCTIEPRKNHAMLFNIWRALYASDRDVLVPLVIVGKVGFNSKDLINIIQLADRLYPRYIKIWTDITDQDLAWLYANCLFSVYPSYYEGWGLPIAESLAHGKLCIASSSSSMSEIAPGLTDLIDPLDQMAWIEKIQSYLRHPAMLTQRENTIKATYKGVRWDECMQEFVASLLDLTPPT